MAIKIQGNDVIRDDKSFVIRTGLTASRPPTPLDGSIWFNSELAKAERYTTQSGWISVSGGSSRGFNSGDVFLFTEDPGPNYVGSNSVVLQSAYPNIFNKVGLIENDRTVYSFGLSLEGSNGRALAYGDGVYVAGGGSGRVSSSTDGIRWTTRTSGTTNQINSMAYGNGVFVRVGIVGTIGTSTDGVTWTVRTSGTTSRIEKVAFGNGTFVYGQSGGGVAGQIVGRRSTDGITWTTITAPNSPRNVTALSYVNGIFLLGTSASATGGSLYKSTDAITWESVSIGLTSVSGEITDLAYGNGIYVAVGGSTSRGTIATSTDAVTWDVRTEGSVAIRSVAYGDGIFLYTTRSQIIKSSIDAVTWRDITSQVLDGTLEKTTLYNDGMFLLSSGERYTRYQFDPSIEFISPKIELNNYFTRISANPPDIYKYYLKE